MSPTLMQPTAARIDELADIYKIRQLAVENAQADLQRSEKELIELVGEFGTATPRSEKSKQLEGDVFELRVTYGQGVEIIESEVEALRLTCAGARRMDVFNKLFATDVRYRVAQTAAVAIDNWTRRAPKGVSRVVELFRRTQTIKQRKPSLKVEPKKSATEKASA